MKIISYNMGVYWLDTKEHGKIILSSDMLFLIRVSGYDHLTVMI